MISPSSSVSGGRCSHAAAIAGNWSVKRFPRLDHSVTPVDVVAPHGMLTLQFAFSTDTKRLTRAKGNTMRFYNMEGSGIEINCYNFSCILGGSNIGLTPVKLKDGTEEWLRATEEDILRAVVNS
jgi:hypothetical protein